MDYRKKKEISRRIADRRYIAVYRSLLEARRVPSSGVKMADKDMLARALVYTALEYYSEAQILSMCGSGPAEVKDTAAPALMAPGSGQRKPGKAAEYPGIDWRNMDNPLVRTADSIYTDRINCWNRLRELDGSLYGGEVDGDILDEYVRLTVRMELCFLELRSFDQTGAFSGCHPFVTQSTERDRIKMMLASDPTAFLDEFKNIEANISRYRSHLRSKKYTEDQRRRDEENLRKYEALKVMYQEILDNRIRR